MKQKLLFFFLTAFLSLIGGGELWADEITVTSSAFLSDTQGSPTVTNCTLDFYGDEGSLSTVPAGEVSGTYYYSKINNDKNFYVLTGYKSFAVGDIVKVYLYAYGTESSTTVACKIGKTAQTVLTQSVTSGSVYELSHTLTASEIEEDGTLRIYRNGANTFFAGVSVERTFTPVSDNTVQTYPYTWDFSDNKNDQWTQSLKDLSLYTIPSETLWQHSTINGADEYRPKVAQENWQYDITLLKGLKFSTASVGVSPCLDYKGQQLWVANNTVITIPGTKVGQIVKITGNVTVSSTSNLTTKTANSEYTVNANGDVTLTFNSSWIKTISVLKTDISAINAIGGTITTNYFDVSSWPCYVVFRNSSNGVLNMSADEWESCSLISSNTSVVTIAKGTVDSGNRGSFTVTPVGAGTSTVTISFPGSDRYNPQDGTIVFTINKHEQTLSFAESTKTINFGDDAPTNTLTQTPAVGGGAVSYSSSNDHVATVNAEGALSINNAGTCIITATAAETTTYAQTSASYTLTVNATSTPTLAWSSLHSETIPDATETVQYGNNFNCYCTNTGSATVQYRSSDTDIATVAIQDGHAGGTSYKYCQITPVNVGTVTITAFVPSYHGEAEQSISFTLTVTKGNIGGKLYFSPNSGTVQCGYTIGPRLKFPSMLAEDIEVLSAVSSNESIATVALEMNDTYLSYQNEKVDGVYPIVRGVNKGTATITVTFQSKKYESATATYTVEVVESQSWNWKESGKEYKLYTEDFMKIPDIVGNTTGNFQLSVGSYNSEHSGYIYDIKKGVITYNNKDWHRGEGVPNYTIVTEGIENPGAAKIFWCKGGDNDGAALFVFAQSAGDVKLRATDTQTGINRDLTIHILNKTSYGTYTDEGANGKNGATYGSSGNVHTNWSQNATTPFTWDFTTNFTVSDDTNCYWIDNGDDTYSLGYPTSFNYDWADTDNNGKTAGSGSNGNEESKFKAIHLKQMEGMTIYLANNDGNWHNKENKVRILAAGTDAQGKPKGRLNINGGTFKLTVPNIPKTALASTYKVFVKAVSNGASEPKVNIVVNGTENGNTPTTTPGIFSADVTTGQKVELWLNNVTIYWIAFSTEANNTAMPNDNKTLTYAATSYSYGKALDLAKSEEVNSGLTAYYASSFTNGEDAASAVTLRQVTLDQNGVPANTGLVLTSGNPSTNYMIADAENQESYTAPTALGTNYLVAGTGSDVPSTVGSGENVKTNFILSYAYKKFADDGTTAMTGYQYDRDWSFYKVMPSATVPEGKAYLQVNGNLRVKPDGTIETITPSGSRRAADGSDDRPANKLMLDIVYEDEAHGFDATTAINDVKTDTVTVDDDAWYTLQGVRVNAPARGGIYIHNGRKVVIK